MNMVRSASTSPRMRHINLHQIQERTNNKLKTFSKQLQFNELTYLKFGFKTEERESNMFVSNFQQSLNLKPQGNKIIIVGSMHISDLWSNKQICKFIEIQKFTKDKYVLQKITKSRQATPIVKNKITDFNVQQEQKQSVKRKTLKQIIEEINHVHDDNIKLKLKLKNRKYFHID